MNDVLTSAATDHFKPTTGLLDPRVELILDRLDHDIDPATENRRSDPRIKYRGVNTFLRITHPGGGTIQRRVISRNLSAGGISVIYNGFLHTGTECTVLLPRYSGGQDSHPAKICHCKHIAGTLHLIGIAFLEKVYPKLYLDPSSWPQLAEQTTVNPKELRGRVLMLDDQDIDRMLFAHFLSDTGMECKVVATPEEAVQAIEQSKWDIVFTDLNLESRQTGEATISLLRAAGFEGPVIAATSETDRTRLSAAWKAGVVAILQKPYTHVQLLGVLSDKLGAVRPGVVQQPIYSSLYTTWARSNGSGPDPAPLVEPYVMQVHRLAADLHEAITAKSLEKIRRICQTIKGSGNGYGFAALTAAAVEALQALEVNGSIDPSPPELDRLQTLCRQVTPAKPPVIHPAGTAA